jgi:hypothetical protein
MNKKKISLSELESTNGSDNNLKRVIAKKLGLIDNEYHRFMKNTDIISTYNGFVYYHTYQQKTKKIIGEITIAGPEIRYRINNELCSKNIFRIFIESMGLKCKFRFVNKYPACTKNIFVFLTE